MTLSQIMGIELLKTDDAFYDSAPCLRVLFAGEQRTSQSVSADETNRGPYAVSCEHLHTDETCFEEPAAGPEQHRERDDP